MCRVLFVRGGWHYLFLRDYFDILAAECDAVLIDSLNAVRQHFSVVFLILDLAERSLRQHSQLLSVAVLLGFEFNDDARQCRLLGFLRTSTRRRKRM